MATSRFQSVWAQVRFAAMDCAGLAQEWENSVELRDAIRKSDYKLIQHPAHDPLCSPNRPNCVANTAILLPMLQRLRQTEQWKLPKLEPLQKELGLLARRMGMNIGPKGVYQPSVQLKKLLSFLKRRATRKEVTKEWGSVAYVVG